MVAGRRLNPDEAEIWAKVAATVRRLERAKNALSDHPEQGIKATAVPPRALAGAREKISKPEPPAAKALPKAPSSPGEHLDGGWDRRLRRGLVRPERSIDLHGYTTASAHTHLTQALDRAVSDGVRVLLVITGKPPRDPAPHRRGLIRAAIGDWLSGSPHAARIAAIRNAHPRHGGAGALYIILRRARSE